jgi:hypothetical protein
MSTTPVSLNPENFAAVQHKAADVLTKVAAALEAQCARTAELEAQLAERDNEAQVHKLASSMEEKGLNSHLSLEEKIAALQEHLKTAGTLDSVASAVDMAASGQLTFATVSDDEIGYGSSDSFLSFCVGQD